MATSQHIVLSYSRDDIEFMYRVRDNLRRVGLQVWTDEDIAEPGSEEWKAAVVKAVRSSSAVLVLMSPAANDSNLVKRTVQLAQSSDVEILPLMIGGEVHQALLPMLADQEYIDLRDDYDANIVQVVRLCYDFRQQKDLRTTAELQKVMVSDVDDEASVSVVVPKIANAEVKVSVSHVKLGDVPKVSKPPEPRKLMPIFIGGLVALVVIVVLVFIVILPLLGGDDATTVIPDATEPPTSVAVVAEATDEPEPTTTPTDVPPTATDEPEATATDEPEPTATNTDEPAPTATNTDEPTDVPPTATTRPSATPRPTEVEPTDVPPSATSAPTQIPPSSTPVPTEAPPTAMQVMVEDANIEILYNGDSLVVHNVGDTSLNLTGMQFVLVGDTDADSVLFIMEEWGLVNNILQSDRCVQVWRTEFSRLPATDPPADTCGSRSAFRSTPSQFWIADGNKTVFEVRQNGDVLAQCDAATRDDNTILSCFVDV